MLPAVDGFILNIVLDLIHCVRTPTCSSEHCLTIAKIKKLNIIKVKYINISNTFNYLLFTTNRIQFLTMNILHIFLEITNLLE